MTKAERKADNRAAYQALMKFYPLTLKNLDGELWKWIPNYEGLYQVSTFGRVKSFAKGKQRILKPTINHHGYLMISLYKGDKKKTFLVSRLVALCFIPNPNNLPEVNHVDTHKLNNSVSNLEWVTHTANMEHANEHGLITYLQGEAHGSAKLTNEQVRWCCEVFIPGNREWGIAALARKLGKSEDIIRRCVHGKTFKVAGGTTHKTQAVKTKCPEEIAIKILAEYKAGGVSQRALAEKYGYNHKTILRIVHER